MTLAHFEQDPSYGSGAYRRVVRLRSTLGLSLATVTDTHHAMWLLLRHDGHVVEDIEAAIERGPATTCGGSITPLKRLVGLEIAGSRASITASLPPSGNCTHLADLARWAIRSVVEHGMRSTAYTITVPDALDHPVWIEVERDGERIHRWETADGMLIGPALLAGRPLFRGFMAWASSTFAGDDLEAAVMLQRGAWVARGRRYIVDRNRVPLSAATTMKDACFSYSGSRWEHATNVLGYVRDFSGGVVEHPLPEWLDKIMGEERHGTA